MLLETPAVALRVLAIFPLSLHSLLLVLLLSLLSACGGGGGGSSDESASGTDASVPDASAPAPGDTAGDGASTDDGGDRGVEPRSIPPQIASLLTDQGLIGPGRIVDDTIAFVGSGEPGEVIEVSLNGQLAGSSLVREDGGWMLDYSMIPLAPGVYEAALQSVAPNGVSTTSVGTFVFTYDPTAPAAPVIRSISEDSATALDAITNDNTLQIAGTGEPDAALELFLDNVLIATTWIDPAGDWQVDYRGTTLADGDYILSAESVVMTLRSATSAQFPLVIDTLAPVAPVVSGIIPDTGVDAADALTNAQQLQFVGSAEPDATVQLQLDGVALGTATAAADGSWQFDHQATTLAEGLFAVRATQTDRAGNTSVLSSPLLVEVDTTPPATVSLLSFGPDSGVAGDGITANDGLIFAGTAPADNWVTVLIDGVAIDTVQADGAGHWQIDHSATLLPDDTYAVTAQVSDAAGNLSVLSSALNITVDTLAPAVPVISSLLSDTGVLGDLLTSDPGVILGGSAEANSTVTLFLAGVMIGSAVADSDGDWTFDYSATALGAGIQLFTAQAQDAAGNLSPVSASVGVTIDMSAPSAPVIVGVTDDTGTGGDAITSDTTPAIRGTAEAGAAITVYRDGAEVGTAVADMSGNWSFNHVGAVLADDIYEYTAMATDNAGNSSSVSALFAVTIDTVAPTITALIPVDDAENVAYTGNLVMAFDSDVIVGSGYITLRRLADDSVFEQIPVTDSRVSISGGQFVVIDPTANLVGETAYAVQVDATAITDVAGNAFAGIIDNAGWNFTVADLELVSSVPADNATGVLLDAEIQLNFNSVANIGSGDIRIRRVSDDSLFATISVTDPQVSGGGGTAITITPPDVFEPNTAYYVEIDAGTFDTVSGASFDGISGSSTLNFVTANPPVPTVTNVTSITANGTYSQNAVISIQVVLSQPVNVTLGTPQLLLDLQGVDRTASYVSGSGSNTLVFSYTVRFGDATPDLDYVAATALTANGARIRSAEHVNASLTLPTPGAAGSLAANRNLVIAATTISVANFTSADGFQVQGSTAGEHVGWAVRGIGDVNGDGFEDFVTGAPYNGGSAGVAYIVYGQAGATRSNINTSAISNGTNGFRIIGQSMLDYLGASVGGAGDINDDGYDDIVVVASRDDNYNTDAGIVYVIFGRASHTDVSISSFNSSHGFRITTAELGAAIGDSVTGYTSNGQALDSGGDFNGDGIQDLVLGIRFSDRNGLDSGKAYVIFGRTGSTRADVNLDLIDPTGPDGVLIQGAGVGWQLGQAARFVGDYDADGYDDVVVSAIYSDGVTSDGGQSFLIFGSPGPIFNAVDVTSLSGVSGFKISSTTSWGVLGHSVAGGDFNGDGINDLFVSQNGYDTTVGAAHVIYGDAGGAYANIDVDTMLSSTGYSIFGQNIGEYLGHSLSSAGDFNGDGLDDLLIASYLRDDNGADSGAAWLITGQVGTARSNLAIGSLDILDGFRMAGGGIGDHFGQSTAFGDINGDGLSDLIIGATWGDNASIDGGETLVLWGREFQSVIVEGLTGTAGADNLVGTSGNDTLVGNGGADAIAAGAGNDIIVVTDTDFVRIDGGKGTDTLALSAGLNTLDLSALGPEVIRGIERIDLGNLGNTLRVSKAGVQALSRESRAVFVRGGSADRVESVLGDAWCYTGTRVVDGVTYHVYLDDGAILYIELGIDHADVGSFSATQTYTFNTTIFGANVSSAVTNFPVLIRVSNTIRNTLRAGRTDIRFTDRDQITWLPYEIEIGASGELLVWVLVPQVDGNSSSDYIVMHYNDKVDDAVPDRQNPAKVWVDYAGVWHFSEASGNALDSTAYQNHGTQTGTVSRESSFIGRGVRFDSATERFTVPYDLSFNSGNKDFTVELWLDGTSNCTAHPFLPQDYMTGISRGEGSSRYWRIQTGGALPMTLGSIVSAPRIEIGDTSGTDSLAALSWLSTDCSNHTVLVHSRTTGTQVYLNGSLYASDGDVRNVENLQNIVIGNSGSTLSDMRIDEVRVRVSSVSAARVRLSYVNQAGTSLVSPNF